ncbi:Membrane protein triplicated sequence [Pseudoalteromonas distincta]
MYVTEALMDYVAAFSQWGFLMAFLYCLASSINKENKSSVYLSALMLCSYVSSGFINLIESLYLNWALYDFITILALLILQYFKVLQRSSVFYFIIISLTINTVLTLIMHYDLYVLYNYEPWWYWSVYSIGVNAIDILMILSLIFNKSPIQILPLKIFTLNPKKLNNE